MKLQFLLFFILLNILYLSGCEPTTNVCSYDKAKILLKKKNYKKIIAYEKLKISKTNVTISELDTILRYFNNIKYFQLESIDIDSLPDNFYELLELKGLSITGTNICGFNNNINKLKKIEGLYISGMAFRKLPDSLSECKKLKIIGLYRTTIPDSSVQYLKSKMPTTKFIIQY